MTIKKSVEVIENLNRVYPAETVLTQFAQLYRLELGQAVAQAHALLPNYRVRVDPLTYRRAQAKLALIGAYLQDDKASVQTLETSLKYVLEQHRVFTGTSAKREQVRGQVAFGLQDQSTSIVKVYKTMLPRQARTLNSELASANSYCRWVPVADTLQQGDVLEENV